MMMQAYVIWFIGAFVLVVAELMSGTLYLLIIGAGAAAAGVLALAGAGFAAQLATAAVVSVAGIGVMRWLKIGGGRRGAHAKSLAFDIGQVVEVIEERPDGSLRVNYRGTQWDATLEGAGGARLVIKEIRGNTLILVAQH